MFYPYFDVNMSGRIYSAEVSWKEIIFLRLWDLEKGLKDKFQFQKLLQPYSI